MSLLTVVQAAALELGLGSVTSVINNTDIQIQQMLAFAHAEGDYLRSRYDWPQLTKEYTFSLVSAQEAYPMPEDIDHVLFETHWVRGRHWPLIGPLSPQEWQYRKSGIVNAGPRQRYRLKGYGTNRLYLDPTPGTGDTGQTCVFEYVSETWILPVAWTTSTAFTAGQYCSYNGNIYLAATSGTTGATPPTHTSSTVSDGGVSWTYRSASYKRFLSDNDTSLLDETVLKLGIQWRFLRSKRLEYDDIYREHESAVRMSVAQIKGAQTLNLNGTRWLDIPVPNVPETGYGGV